MTNPTIDSLLNRFELSSVPFHTRGLMAVTERAELKQALEQYMLERKLEDAKKYKDYYTNLIAREVLEGRIKLLDELMAKANYHYTDINQETDSYINLLELWKMQAEFQDRLATLQSKKEQHDN